MDRRIFMSYFSAAGLSGTLFPGVLYAQVADGAPITAETIAHAEHLAGLEFTAEERLMMIEDLTRDLEGYQALRELSLPNHVIPALRFDPGVGGVQPPAGAAGAQWEPPAVERPSSDEDLAFLTVAELAVLLRSRRVSSIELTELYLARLREYDPVLQAVVTFTEERAREQANLADRELDAGHWRGPLHGIPYGAKDLLSVAGYPTTWGAVPYQEQFVDEDAAVIQRLEEAGAVLIAKLTLGALAWGDVWFGGMTRNPWNIEQGSSGSSAGPGSAVAAGLVGFAIGSETLGSIVSPSTRNGVTGHRPTFGLVSRYGAMALSWSMDKLGPMARSAEDCALIFDAIRGRDERDATTVDAPFPYDPRHNVSELRVGYLADAFDEEYQNREADHATLEVLRSLGVELRPMKLPSRFPLSALLKTLSVEAATAFDELTRTRGIDRMVRQTKDAWPHVFRTARFVPAVEYLQASRARTLLMREMAEVMADYDAFVTPSYGGSNLSITNLTGHPCVCVPNHFAPLEDVQRSERRRPGSITFVGQLYNDASALALATAYQRVTPFHRMRPPIR
jgi:Asp-tRNA(Asn)/Glu-tRNA(Gln) amidotransferase A subunit family amidase